MRRTPRAHTKDFSRRATSPMRRGSESVAGVQRGWRCWGVGGGGDGMGGWGCAGGGGGFVHGFDVLELHLA